MAMLWLLLRPALTPTHVSKNSRQFLPCKTQQHTQHSKHNEMTMFPWDPMPHPSRHEELQCQSQHTPWAPPLPHQEPKPFPHCACLLATFKVFWHHFQAAAATLLAPTHPPLEA